MGWWQTSTVRVVFDNDVSLFLQWDKGEMPGNATDLTIQWKNPQNHDDENSVTIIVPTTPGSYTLIWTYGNRNPQG